MPRHHKNQVVKTCSVKLKVYNKLYLCISLRCPKQGVLRTLINIFYTLATESKHTSLYALILKQHPCCFWLGINQSPKNN